MCLGLPTYNDPMQLRPKWRQLFIKGLVPRIKLLCWINFHDTNKLKGNNHSLDMIVGHNVGHNLVYHPPCKYETSVKILSSDHNDQRVTISDRS